MKSLVTIIVVLFGLSSAHAKIEKNCKLEGGLGPFANFQITLPAELSEMKTGDEVKVSGYFNKASGSVYTDRRINWTANVTNVSGPLEFWIDYIDWATVTFRINDDDEGISAYLEHRSDGPSLNSYYRCN